MAVTYSELTQQILDYTEVSTDVLTATRTNDFIEHAENRIFRDVTGNLFGAAVTELEDEDGYSITKTNDDFYTFTVSTAPGITGNGGGGFASAGPATLSN